MAVYFVTGTDTDAGKTLVTSALLRAARQQTLTTLGLKPIASGCRLTPTGFRNNDALALKRESTPAVSYRTVNPWAFAPAIAPHLAANEAGEHISVSAVVATLQSTLKETPRALTLIEGAGGWRVPLNAEESFCAIPHALSLPVILVVGLTLGCLNHALLTAEAISRDGLQLVGWVGSVVDPAFSSDQRRFQANISLLKNTLTAPCLGIIPYLAKADAAHACRYLSLSELLDDQAYNHKASQ